VRAVNVEVGNPESSASGATDWKMFLVQELCDASLMDMLEGDAFTLADDLPNYKDLMLTLMEVAQGCDYIHSKNIIHGDLKLENVLVKLDNESSKGFQAKVRGSLERLLISFLSHTFSCR
jgi:serine/threonine protein kinase